MALGRAMMGHGPRAPGWRVPVVMEKLDIEINADGTIKSFVGPKNHSAEEFRTAILKILDDLVKQYEKPAALLRHETRRSGGKSRVRGESTSRSCSPSRSAAETPEARTGEMRRPNVWKFKPDTLTL